MRFDAQFDRYHEEARAATGLEDFGANEYHAALRLLLSELDEHMRFNAVGIAMIHADITQRLCGRLLAVAGFKAHAASIDAPLLRPLVIIGMARTGTTALFRLLLEDDNFQSLPMWLACAPMPRPPRHAWDGNPWFQSVRQGLEQMYEFSPAIREAHPMAAEAADECRFAMNHVFWSPDYVSTATVPAYMDWIVDGDARDAYRYHRRVLNLIAAGDSRCWLLKDPCHLYNLDSLLAVYPDARIICTHRDPMVSCASVASLTFLLRSIREDQPDPIAHGKLTLASWGRPLDQFERRRCKYDPRQFIDVHHDAIRRDPIATVERVYRHFGMPVTDSLRAAWTRRVLSDPKSGHGAHRYTPEQFGFTPDLLRKACGAYYGRYAQAEHDAASH